MGLIDKIVHPIKTSEKNAENSGSLHEANHSGPVEELPADKRVVGNPHHGNKHDHHPTPNDDRVEHPVGFGKPGYTEGNAGLGPAGAGGMKWTT